MSDLIEFTVVQIIIRSDLDVHFMSDAVMDDDGCKNLHSLRLCGGPKWIMAERPYFIFELVTSDENCIVDIFTTNTQTFLWDRIAACMCTCTYGRYSIR